MPRLSNTSGRRQHEAIPNAPTMPPAAAHLNVLAPLMTRLESDATAEARCNLAEDGLFMV